MQLHLRIDPLYLFIRGVLPLALLGFSVAVVLLVNSALNSNPAKAEQAVLDLRHWDSASDDVLLVGEWGFYWDQYLLPDEVSNKTFTEAPVYLQLPGVWNNTQYEGRSLPLLGHASLVLRLLLPSNDSYLLKVPTLTNRYRLWINGELKVNDPLEQSHAYHQKEPGSRFFTINPVDGEAVLLFHIQNDRHRAGGIWERLRVVELGRQARIDFWPKMLDGVLAFLLSCGALILIVKAIRTRRWSYLYLALFAAFMSLRAGTVNERLLFSVMGIEDWELQQALEHGVLFATLPFFALYLGTRFPSYFPPMLHWVTTAVNGALLALVVITPASIYSHTIPVFQATALIYAFLWMGATLEHVRNKERAALLLLLGGMIFIVSGVNDILYTTNWIDSINLTHAGALGFLIVAFFYRGEMVKQGVMLEAYTVSQTQEMETQKTEVLEAKNSKENARKSPQEKAPVHPVAAYYQSYQKQQDDKSRKKLAAESLRFALGVWEQATENNKVSLAEVSGLWRVTNDGGTLKTRTLDKYLKADTLPQKPRYKLVSKTLRFIAKQEGVAEGDMQWMQKVADVYEV